jgi:hypothetical protein
VLAFTQYFRRFTQLLLTAVSLHESRPSADGVRAGLQAASQGLCSPHHTARQFRRTWQASPARAITGVPTLCVSTRTLVGGRKPQLYETDRDRAMGSGVCLSGYTPADPAENTRCFHSHRPTLQRTPGASTHTGRPCREHRLWGLTNYRLVKHTGFTFTI